ncbi:CU044_2847 family protein [Streptomyces sp. NPDC047043]|uniref:CU044_2847 family protein n=1 Tax=Streptomyces sp. NPDC047043 TaxID=3154497 RepID=UPI00340217AD
MAKRAHAIGGGGPPEILLEVQPRSVSGDLAPRVALPEQFQRRAGEIADSVAQVADQFRSRLETVLRRPPDGGWAVESIEVGFDLSVQADAGVIIAKATSGATFSARLTLKAAPDAP